MKGKIEGKQIAPMAQEALEDFERILTLLGRESLDEEGMVKLLKSLNYEGNGSEIFWQLCAHCSAATGTPVLTLDASALRALYQSETYSACADLSETGRELMSAVSSVFDQFDVDGSGYLDREEIKMLIEHLAAGRPLHMIPKETVQLHRASLPVSTNASHPSHQQTMRRLSVINVIPESPLVSPSLNTTSRKRIQEPKKFKSDLGITLTEPEIDLIANQLDCKGECFVTREELGDVLLRRPPKRERCCRRLRRSVLNPGHASGEEFVSEVERFVLDHAAVNHHLLDSIALGSFGDDTVAVVAHFLEAYICFSKDFVRYLNACAQRLDNAHYNILLENRNEEEGVYNQADKTDMEKLGLDPAMLENVPHRDLALRCLQKLKQVGNVESLSEEQQRQIASSLVTAFEATCLSETSCPSSSISAMYFGSEFISTILYTKLTNYLKHDKRLSSQDLAFFLLHMEMDKAHFRKMRRIVVEHAQTKLARWKMLPALEMVANARVDFFDRLVQSLFPGTGHGSTSSSSLYNAQSTNWVRKEKVCLSDFTGRPVVFGMCAPHVKGATILDVGCGEGYAARKLVKMGAQRVIGIDISRDMITRAQEQASEKEKYIIGDAVKLEDLLLSNDSSLGEVERSLGFIDLAIGIFVFNYTSITQMNRICEQVYDILRPGDHFIFSVPHPGMLFSHGSADGTNRGSFSFEKGKADNAAYFSLRDIKFGGTIKCLDGRVLNVKMCFKRISDYVDAAARAGFEILYIHEARVLPEHVSEHPSFFESVEDSPLHLVFKVRKGLDGVRLDTQSTLDAMPRAIRWTAIERNNCDSALVMSIPQNAHDALISHASALVDMGVDAEKYVLTEDDKDELKSVSLFAAHVRRRLDVEMGAALIRGLDLETLGGDAAHELNTKRAKLAYYILCSFIGQVDSSARGRLFDVRDHRLDPNADNVLFSVSNTEAGWHTDGASRERIYDVVSLLCITQSSSGGEFRISNACNALDYLKSKLPKFLLYELLRPLPRDVLENGSGKGHADVLTTLCRTSELLKLRIRHNAYPIFVEGSKSRMRFRYMRYWIQSGHKKAGLQISPLLRVAMDLLDQSLDNEQIFDDRLRPGDMVFSNNLLIPHSRRAFQDEQDKQPRHMVRAWIQIQKL